MNLLPHTLRSRTAFFIASAFVLFLSLFFVTSYWSIRTSLIDRSDGEVRRELSSIASELHSPFSSDSLRRILFEHRSIGESPLTYLILEKENTRFISIAPEPLVTIPRRAEELLERNSRLPIDFSTSDGDMRLIGLASGNFILGAAYNTTVLEEAQESIIDVFAYYLLAGIIIATLAAIVLSRYLIGPIGALAKSAHSILTARDHVPARLPIHGTIAEVDELARSINALLDAREQAIESEKNFAADAAHELRTPLTVLKGELEVELRLQPSGEHAELLHSNLEEIERLISTVQDLLDLAEIEVESVGSNEECSLRSAIYLASDRLAPLAKDRSIALQMPTNDVIIPAQERRMSRLVYNLLLNAIQHSRAESTVTVRIESTTEGCRLDVEDCGEGIIPERIEHLFERFYRAGREDRRGGAGLGLAIVKSIADRHGFTLAIRSSLGSGTTVCVGIPIKTP